ncbi:PLP-dependent transferase [Clavulina sp. PMI_390]|nr:PLP-dependent transferase [Clavulina sp. PMI_390]
MWHVEGAFQMYWMPAGLITILSLPILSLAGHPISDSRCRRVFIIMARFVNEKNTVYNVERDAPSSTYGSGKPTVDLSHHFSELSKARINSPLKDIFKYMDVPGIIGMAGGLPHPDYFPFDSLSAQALVPDAFSIESSASNLSSESSGMFNWLWQLFGSSVPTKTMVVPKYDADPAAMQLSSALQYTSALGQPLLVDFVNNFMHSVYKPARKDASVMLHAGNTDAFTKALGVLCNPGELLITEEWAYTSALSAARPYGVKPVGIPMDGQGMRADALEEVLANWDEKTRGAARPHVMYTVPIGQNPTGTTMGVERRKAIYEICVKYDANRTLAVDRTLAVERLYYFLQVGVYQDPKHRVSRKTQDADDDQVFLDSLVPSYIHFDYQGRVVRLDTFSKVIAPGCRLGWYTASPLFLERLERATETSTQAPSGFSQALVTQLLTKQWKYKGYIRWLRGIRAQYTIRRDTMVDAIRVAFDLQEEYGDSAFGKMLGASEPGSGDAVRVFVARSKNQHLTNEQKKAVLLSYVAPTAGMFIWFKVHLYNHPLFNAHAPAPTTPAETLEYKLWEDLSLGGILMCPGWVFGTSPDAMLTSSALPDVAGMVEAAEKSGPEHQQYRTLSEGGRFGYLRISYSNPTAETLKEGLARFARVLDKHFFGA